LIGIRELARHLDISIGTVSRALNGKVDVNPQTRARVLAAAASLGYSPNQSGRSLRRGKTDLAGVIIPVGSESVLIDTVFLSVLDGLRRRLLAARLDLAIFLQGADEDILGPLRRLIERGPVDGVIIADTLQADPRIDYLLEKRQPFVAFGRSLSGGTHPWVDPDFEGAVAGAVDHLVAMGHRRIALMLPPRTNNYCHLIVNSYREALRRRGLAASPEWLYRLGEGEAGGYHAGSTFLGLTPAPTAILTSNAGQTIGLYRRLEEAGVRPGRDIAVFGILPEARMQTLSPPLSAFVTDWTAIGATLGEALTRALGIGESEPASADAKAMQVVAPVAYQAGESVNRLTG
jgi:DNA-binding LacI/PurR family transcriptional regulator